MGRGCITLPISHLIGMVIGIFADTVRGYQTGQASIVNYDDYPVALIHSDLLRDFIHLLFPSLKILSWNIVRLPDRLVV